VQSKKAQTSVTKKTKDRAKYKCPDGLARLIELVNLADDRDKIPHDPARDNDPAYIVARRVSEAIHVLAQIAAALPGRMMVSKPHLSIQLTITEDGRITSEVFDKFVLDSLIGVDATRLRECEICQRIFWARQENMVACSPRCSNVNRQRRLRERRADYERTKQKARQKTRRK
jgi:hypothetical protein